MRTVLTMALSFVLVLACYGGVSSAAFGDNNLFLRSKKQTEALDKQNQQRRNTAPIVRRKSKPSLQQRATPQRSALKNYLDMPCTKKDMKAYAQIDKAMVKAFSIDESSLTSDSKRTKAQKAQVKAAEKFADFINDEKNGKAYVALLGRCSAQISALK